MRNCHRIALGWLIAGLVVVTISITLRDSIHAAGDTLGEVAPLAFCVLVVPSVLMMVATGFSFSLVVLPRSNTLAQRSSVVGIFLTAQVIKYLPGRIWGFAYQLKSLSKHAHGSLVLIASLNHLVLTVLMSIFFLGVAFGVTGAWLLLLIGTLLVLLWVQRGGVAVYLAWMKKIPAATLARLPLKTVLGIGISLSLEWFFYLAVWAGLFMLLQMPPNPEHILSVASFYAGAWIIGSLASLVPGGLGVREGGFIVLGLGLGIPEPKLVALAILARLIFTFSEILTGALAAGYLRKKVLL